MSYMGLVKHDITPLIGRLALLAAGGIARSS
jgi:hypothetical protein